MNKIDILAIGVHPDDVELCCSGTLMKHIQAGYKVAILDLTRGELGTRGSADIRDKEAAAAAKILGVGLRDNLGFRDGFFTNDEVHQIKLIEKIRLYRPDVVLTNAVRDRHPDHGRAAQLVKEACFYAGLLKVETKVDGKKQNHWRPKAVYHSIQDRHIPPDFVVDITEYYNKKMEAIMAFSSQFYNPESDEPSSPISSKTFLEFVEARMREFGRIINTTYGEGFTSDTALEVNDVLKLS